MTIDSSDRLPWDSYAAYLFDIDGTLLHCADAVHYHAFCKALGSVAGRPLNLDGVITHGNVDAGILRDALALAGIPEEKWRPKLLEACVNMGAFVEARKQDLRIDVLPSVVNVLDHLQKRGAVLGVATGNLEAIARLKLDSCGLLDRLSIGGYSDGFEYRSDVFRYAVQKTLALVGESATICVVGDTPEDIRAARANGLDVIAVATGVYSFEALAAEEPDWCLHNLGELSTSR